MALLTRTNILSNERLDKPDFDNIENFVIEDFNAMLKFIFSDNSKVVSGFRVFQDSSTLVDNPTASPVFIKLEDSTLIHTDGSGTPFMYVGATGLSAASVDLVASATNFVEMELSTTTSGADTRAFWDPAANGGDGAEFTQIVNTAKDLIATFTVNNVGFSGGTKVPVAEITLTGAVITANIDKRNLFFRLGVGQPVDPTNDFPWPNTQTDPNPDRVLDANAYLGADKAISSFKQWMDAVMTEIKRVKGTSLWFEIGAGSVTGVNNFINSFLSQNSAAARFSWSGTALSVTDDNGGPADADVVGKIRMWTKSTDFDLTRQDGTGGSSTITIADGEILFVELPTSGSRVYSGTGSGSTNYQTVARGSFVANDQNYWLGFREGSNLYLRGMGELEPTESAQISDNINESILTAAGLASETASPSYTAVTSGSLNLPDFNTTPNEAWIPRIAKLNAMLADTKQDFNVEIDPGTIVWDGANVTITSAQLSIPGTTIGGAPVGITNLPSTALPDNSCYYVDINRTTAGSLTLTQSTLALLTPSQQRLVVVRRLGTNLLVR